MRGTLKVPGICVYHPLIFDFHIAINGYTCIIEDGTVLPGNEQMINTCGYCLAKML